jgi:hypothetical protein
MEFLANFAANLLQRAFGSKPNTMLTVTGLIAAGAAGLAAFPPAALPVKYQPYLVAVAGFAGALAGILGHGQNAELPPSVTK